MLAPSDQIISKTGCFGSWLRNAGTDATSRKLILKDVDAYNALANNIAYLPNDWKKGKCNVLDGTPYVTFSANAAQTFKLENHGYFPSNIEYSVGTDDWKTLEADKEIPFGGDLGNLQLRATENLKGTASDDSKYSQIIFGNSTKVACTGDIRTLLDYRDFKNVTTRNALFCFLFEGCTVLTSAPDLPATQLANKCYYFMFHSCTSLTKAPELPAETLPYNCYVGMFYGCTDLTSVTMLAPSDQITGDRFIDWLPDEGVDPNKSRTLKVKDEAAYNALVDKGCLPADYWQKGKCTVN